MEGDLLEENLALLDNICFAMCASIRTDNLKGLG